jgi:hypothetical protein
LIQLCVILFRELFHLVVARRIHNPYSGKAKTRRGRGCHDMLDPAGLRAFAIVAWTD